MLGLINAVSIVVASAVLVCNFVSYTGILVISHFVHSSCIAIERAESYVRVRRDVTYTYIL